MTSPSDTMTFTQKNGTPLVEERELHKQAIRATAAEAALATARKDMLTPAIAACEMIASTGGSAVHCVEAIRALAQKEGT